MKRALPLLLVLMTGCIVQSLYPFYTDKSKVTLPGLNGDWDCLVAFGDKQEATNVPPWQITDDKIIPYDPDSQTATIRVVFFKVNGQLFCDSFAGDIGNSKVPSYWYWHVRPVHTITKVETNADQLVLKPLDLVWLTNLVASSKVSLPHVRRPEDDNWPLFTAKPADWERFLTKYAKSTDAFPTDHMYVLKRHVNPSTNQAPTK
jgi:hypothetical protein